MLFKLMDLINTYNLRNAIKYFLWLVTIQTLPQETYNLQPINYLSINVMPFLPVYQSVLLLYPNILTSVALINIASFT